MKSPGNESNSKLNVNEEDYNADDRGINFDLFNLVDRIQVLVRESIRPSEAKLIDFGEVKNGAEILEQLENKENRDTTRKTYKF